MGKRESHLVILSLSHFTPITNTSFQQFLDYPVAMDRFLSFVLVLILSISFTNVFEQPFAYVNGDTDLIQRTCKTTKYYDLCLSSLKSDSTSPVADTKGLAVIMVRIGMANATSTNSYLTSQLFPPKTTNSNDALKKRVLKECAEKYLYAGVALKSTLQNLKDELYDYASRT